MVSQISPELGGGGGTCRRWCCRAMLCFLRSPGASSKLNKRDLHLDLAGDGRDHQATTIFAGVLTWTDSSHSARWPSSTDIVVRR